MAQQYPNSSRRRFLRGGIIGVVGGVLLPGCHWEVSGIGGSKAPLIEWSKTFGGEKFDTAGSVIETNDGDYLFAGNTRSFSEESENAWVVKLDEKGNEKWIETFGDRNKSLANSLIKTSDGGYLFAGGTWSPIKDAMDSWVVKLRNNGREEWNYTFGGDSTELAFSVVETSDRDYVFAGETRSFGETVVDAWVVKLNDEGTKQWSANFSEKEWDRPNSIIETSDGGYLFAGGTRVIAEEVPSNAWVVKLDARGVEEWRKIFGDNGGAGAVSVIEVSDGGYLFVGNRTTRAIIDLFSNSGAWVVKLSTEGTVEWSESFGGEFFEQDTAKSVIETTDGGYIFAGGTRSFADEGIDAWVVKLNFDGKEEWRKVIGNDGRDMANDIINTSDGAYLFTGETESIGGANWDAWVVKLADYE